MSELDQLLPVPSGAVRKNRGTVRRRFFLLSLVGCIVLLLNAVVIKGSGLWRVPFWLKHSYAGHFIFGSDPLTKAEVETEYILVLQSSNLARNWSERYTHETHLAGSYPLANWTAQKFEEYGLETKIEDYYVYLNTPKDNGLSLLKNDKVIYTATLLEDEIPEDPTSYGDDRVPAFHGYSASGNVTGEYFYANYGRKQDFDQLAELGVNMTGKIAVVRYGLIYRGLKVRFAQQHGAIGVVIYTDPDEDGEITAENGYAAYPKGPARQPSSIQRGSVMMLSYGPGDPTTPGYSSNKPDVERQDPHGTIPEIPSLPISFKEALPILSQLNGTGLSASHFGKDWVGKLPGFDYSVGPSTPKFTLNLYNDQEYNITTIHNVIGITRGHIDNEVILVGNHRDAWIKGGASDPNSGSASILEMLRSFAELQKKGYKPLRTIVWALWDGEEAGLLGSTEWGEEYADKLENEVVAYLNLDASVAGPALALEGTPSLNKILLEAAKKVKHPDGVSLYDNFLLGPSKGKINILGSGSDYTVFLDHLAIPSVSVGFEPDEKSPVYHYHSNYDSFYWMEKFGDPNFIYHNLMSQYLGLVLLSISDQEVINFNITTYGEEIQKYFTDAISSVPKAWRKSKVDESLLIDIPILSRFVPGELVKKISKEIKQVKNKIIYKWREEHNHNNHNHRRPHRAGKKHPKSDDDDENQFIDLVELTNSTIAKFIETAVLFDSTTLSLQYDIDHLEGISPWKRVKLFVKLKYLNWKLIYLERHFLHTEGLVNRPWFKHCIYASGRYTGYEGQSLPGLREAIEDDVFQDAVKWLNTLWQKLDLMSSIMRN